MQAEHFTVISLQRAQSKIMIPESHACMHHRVIRFIVGNVVFKQSTQSKTDVLKQALVYACDVSVGVFTYMKVRSGMYS